MNLKILVCPVAFNENVKIRSVIERFLKSPAHETMNYLVVDDCSTDDTTSIIRSYASRGVKTIKHEKRSGVGAAIRTAIRYAQKNNYDVLVIMAGNDKDNPDEIPNVIGPIVNDGYDFVQGSRYYGRKGTGGDMPFYRKVATKLYPLLFSVCVCRRLTDTSNGFRAFKLSLLEDKRIDIDQDWLNQYELEPYMLYKTITLGYKFTEAFVTKIYPPKKLGYTKMKPITGWWSIFRPLVFLRLGIKK
jgi:dolichol-phosphate mannosyltransferase